MCLSLKCFPLEVACVIITLTLALGYKITVPIKMRKLILHLYPEQYNVVVTSLMIRSTLSNLSSQVEVLGNLI